MACILIVLFILLQHPKGGGILGALGGGMGGKSLFSAGGASGFLVQTTKWLTVVFAITSLSLSYMSAHQKEDSIMKDSSSPAAAEQPVQSPSQQPAGQSPPESLPGK